MPGMPKLHLEDALEDSPQTRNLLSVFERDAMVLKKYSAGLHSCCQRVMSAQNELCAATQALSQHLRGYELQKFPLESENSILTSTLEQFASFLDNISSLQQVLAAQFSEAMMFPLTKAMQADLEEISTMYEMFQIATHEHEQAWSKFMRVSKKKDSSETNHDLFLTRKKFHQTALHYYSSLNSMQYKRRCFLLEPIVGYLHAQRAYFSMGQEAVCKPELEEFLNNINASIQSVHSEMNVETTKTVELIDSLEKQSAHLYHAEPPIDMPYIPPNISLGQKSGYLFIRSKQLIGNRWDKCFFFTQGGNMMSQARDEVAGSLVVDLNEDGIFSEPAEADDRRNVFQINTAKHRRFVVLQAENERERDEWISTLNNIVREGGFVKGKPGRKDREGSSSSVPSQQSGSSPSPSSPGPDSASSNHSVRPQSLASSAQSGAPSPASAPTPSSPFSMDTPIQFDLVSPSDVNGSVKSLTGPPKRINPFDQSAIDVIDALDEAIDNAAFTESFLVRFLGSMEVKQDRGEKLVHETIRQIMAARAIHNVFKMTESRMLVTNEYMRLIDPSNNTVRIQFALEDISYWSSHPENNRLFGFITRNKGEGSYACHVFESGVSAEEICQAISTATKMAFHALMEKKAEQKIKTLKDKEKNLLLDNIGKLEDKGSDEEEGGDLASRLPLSPDGKYLVLTTPDEEDMLEEMDREMGSLNIAKPPSPQPAEQAPPPEQPQPPQPPSGEQQEGQDTESSA